MRHSISLAKQSAKPEGWFGRVVAFLMSFETREVNHIALTLCDLKEQDRLLEIGFGHGNTIKLASQTITQGITAGIDISSTMLKMAKKNNKMKIQQGLVKLKLASVDCIPYPDQYFNKVISIHTLYFWQDYNRALSEIWRVLGPQGKILIGFRYDQNAIENFPPSVYSFKSAQEVATLLEKNRFKVDSHKTQERSNTTTYWITATKQTTLNCF
jgi:ubiquinone/menaquinone biosynthesis C-methylase UbiE